MSTDKNKLISDEVNILEGTIEISTYLGSIVRYEVKVGEVLFMVDYVYSAGKEIYGEGEPIFIGVPYERVLLI